jgi:hypothetical protein
MAREEKISTQIMYFLHARQNCEGVRRPREVSNIAVFPEIVTEMSPARRVAS